MIWDIRNYGWPIPYNDSWPISSKKELPKENLNYSTNKSYKIEPLYGYTYFDNKSVVGTEIDVWV